MLASTLWWLTSQRRGAGGVTEEPIGAGERDARLVAGPCDWGMVAVDLIYVVKTSGAVRLYHRPAEGPVRLTMARS
jgi:hypothetical protein